MSTTTTSTSTTSSTIAGIAGHVPLTPQTVPLRTHALSATLDPVYGQIAGVAACVLLLLLLVQFLLTRSGRRARRTL